MTHMVFSVPELLEEAIAALARADWRQLAQYAEEASNAVVPETAEERLEVKRLHRTLGRLLALTARNLRLLGAAHGVVDGYGMRRG